MRTAAALIFGVVSIATLSSQGTDAVRADLAIRADRPGPAINRNIYGHFAEHLGRLIYDGLWVGDGSPIPNTRGMRNDIVGK